MEKWSKNNHLRLIIITALAKKYGFTNRYIADIVALRKTTAKMEQILQDYTTLTSIFLKNSVKRLRWLFSKAMYATLSSLTRIKFQL